MAILLVMALLAAIVAGTSVAAQEAAPQEAAEPQTRALIRVPRYTFQKDHDPNGIGKFYLGREIARVMGHQGIAWLERPEREEEERLSLLVECLELKPGMVVADIGAGSGVISTMMARKVAPTGTVLAVDIQQEMLDALAARCKQLGIENVEPVLGTTKSPQIPEGTLDLAIMVDVYHEFDFPYEMLREIVKALKPGGRIAFVEYRREDPEVPIKLVHKMSEAQVKKEALQPEFGLRWHKTFRKLPRQHVVFFRKAEAGAAVSPGQWPQFRGPDGLGHADGASLPLTWSETENVIWKTPVPGVGWSSPVVFENEVWITTAAPDGRSLRAVCVDLASGALRHDVEVFQPEKPCEINKKNSYASPSPVIDAGRLYVHYGTLGTAALDVRTGKVLWRNNDLVLDHKEGPGSSPVLYGDLLIVTCDGMDVQYVAALEAATGKLVWRRDRSAPLHSNPDYCKAYATPLVIHADGRDQLVSPGAHQVHAYDPATGEEMWHVRYEGFSNVPRPVYDPQAGRVYVCTGYVRPQLWAIRTGGSGNVTDTHVLWKATQQVPGRASPVLVGDRLYMVSDGGVATCLDRETGDTVWQSRVGGNFSASPLAVDERIYLCSEEGTITVIAAADEYQVLGETTLDATLMASLAVADGALLLRTDRELWRIESER